MSSTGDMKISGQIVDYCHLFSSHPSWAFHDSSALDTEATFRANDPDIQLLIPALSHAYLEFLADVDRR